MKNLNRFLEYDGMEAYKGAIGNENISRKKTGNSNLGVDIFG